MPGAVDPADAQVGSERYRGVAGTKDILILLRSTLDLGNGDQSTVVWQKWVHQIMPEGFQRMSRPSPIGFLTCREDDCVLCEMAKKEPRVLVSNHGDPFKAKFVAFVGWLATKTKHEEAWRPIGKAMPWAFGGDKMRSLRPIFEMLKERAKGMDGDKDKNYARLCAQTELLVVCDTQHDQKTQNLTINKSEYPSKLGAVRDQLVLAVAEAKKAQVMRRYVVPPSNEELRQMALQKLGADRFDTEELERGHAGGGSADPAAEAERLAKENVEENLDGLIG